VRREPAMGVQTTARGANGGALRPGVLVCDAQPPFRTAIARAIQEWPEFKLLGTTSPAELPDALIKLEPDVAVIDHASFDTDPDAILNYARPTTRVVFLSESQDSETIFAALSGGAVAYLPKTVTPREVCHTIAAAARGGAVIAPAVQPMLARSLHAREPHHGPELTRREQQVLGLMAEGLTVRQAAQRLGLRPGTVRTHVEHLTESLGVHGQKAALVAAMRAGLLK
jgi:two-component system, NarL family, nitrate/nitrite response regulator NarL